MRIAFVWDQFSEYHADRCEAVAAAIEGIEVIGVEFATASRIYNWPPSAPGLRYRKVTIYPGAVFEQTHWFGRFGRLMGVVSDCDTVFMAGYARPDINLAALLLRLAGRRVVLMNDSKFNDRPRQIWREWLKGFVLTLYNAALVAGEPHAEYLKFLRFRGPIAFGYDTVSLARLAGYAEGVEQPPMKERPLLFVGRFVPKKNLAGLLDAYALYVDQMGEVARPLVLVGDGPLRADVEARIAALGLADRVTLTGFLNAPEVAIHMRRAFALAIPSIEEQWGLVVNEALAFDLPIIASTVVGAAGTLIRSGVNGLLVEPDNAEGLARALVLLDHNPDLWRSLSAGSRRLAPKADVSEFVDGVRAVINRPVAPPAAASAMPAPAVITSRTPPPANLFIVGAMKAGTTSVYNTLATLDGVFAPAVKEPNFFSMDLHRHPGVLMQRTLHNFANNPQIADPKRYADLYREAPPSARYRVDGSTTYLYSTEAAANIARYAPDARIVILLRDPVARAWSEYRMNVAIGLETRSFHEALDRERIALSRGEPMLLRRYVQAGLYGPQVRRYLDEFPREQLFVEVVDRPGKGLGASFELLTAFLDLPPAPHGIMYENEAREPISQALNRTLYYSGLKALVSRVVPGTVKNAIKATYYRARPEPMPADERTATASVFEESNEMLKLLLGLDVEHWEGSINNVSPV